ncbi:pyrroline-5-carboxylate reductase family protein, partial [Salmonella enterica]|uniref:pyrroline-5-carboxylate reductase family protein n=2 Tax=Bacteria TaxID=2 RepID=UPI0022B5EA4E
TTSFAIETNTHPCTSSQKLAESVDVLVLAVKPGVIPTVLKELHTTFLKHQPLLVSIAAGTTIASLEDTLESMQKHPIIRVMPNLNALIGKG